MLACTLSFCFNKVFYLSWDWESILYTPYTTLLSHINVVSSMGLICVELTFMWEECVVYLIYWIISPLTYSLLCHNQFFVVKNLVTHLTLLDFFQWRHPKFKSPLLQTIEKKKKKINFSSRSNFLPRRTGTKLHKALEGHTCPNFQAFTILPLYLPKIFTKIYRLSHLQTMCLKTSY